jgi:hypothetical protein
MSKEQEFKRDELELRRQEKGR